MKIALEYVEGYLLIDEHARMPDAFALASRVVAGPNGEPLAPLWATCALDFTPRLWTECSRDEHAREAERYLRDGLRVTTALFSAQPGQWLVEAVHTPCDFAVVVWRITDVGYRYAILRREAMWFNNEWYGDEPPAFLQKAIAAAVDKVRWPEAFYSAIYIA